MGNAVMFTFMGADIWTGKTIRTRRRLECTSWRFAPGQEPRLVM
jgi:hypothetical protein